MAKRKNDITLSKTALNTLKKNIEERFYQEVSTSLPFSGAKESEIYTLLQNEITETAKITVSLTTLRDVMTLKHKGIFMPDVHNALNKYARTPRIITLNESTTGAQRIYWGVNQGLAAGAFIERIDGEFIPWEILKKELEERAIVHCPKFIPPGSKIVLRSFYGKEDWVIEILITNQTVIGSVWIGSNPYDDWSQDGFVRIGKTISDSEHEVFQVLARFPDASYRVIKSFV